MSTLFINISRINFNIHARRKLVNLCKWTPLIQPLSVGFHKKVLMPSRLAEFCNRLHDGPDLRAFIEVETHTREYIYDIIPYINSNRWGAKQRVYFDVYGCQMNVNDTEVVWSILQSHNYVRTSTLREADVVLLVTCSIRENAEDKIKKRLHYLRSIYKNCSRNVTIGILGCMAERLKEYLLDGNSNVDLVVGPDSYRDLPRLLDRSHHSNEKSINVILSFDETYADILPVRLNPNTVTAYVSVMRGCENMCTYCIVPFTRGKERSRPIESIKQEVKSLVKRGVKEITLLGQNVNSYRDITQTTSNIVTQYADGFRAVYKPKIGGLRFHELLKVIAEEVPDVRIRFTSPHPKDFPDQLLEVISGYANICKMLHLPAQSGNTAVLERMRRGYTRTAYIKLVNRIKEYIPSVALSSDFICGFCGETEEEFQDTLSLMTEVKYHVAYMFKYSMREKTTAHRRYKDDVPAMTKQDRLQRMVKLFRHYATDINLTEVGRKHLVLVEGKSRRSDTQWTGRNDQNIRVIFPMNSKLKDINGTHLKIKPGDFIAVRITDANSQTLRGTPLYRTSMSEFNSED